MKPVKAYATFPMHVLNTVKPAGEPTIIVNLGVCESETRPPVVERYRQIREGQFTPVPFSLN